MLVGDLTYADDHLLNDTATIDWDGVWDGAPRACSGRLPPMHWFPGLKPTLNGALLRGLGCAGPSVTYQPRWDTWGRFMEPLASRVPLMTTSGNRAPCLWSLRTRVFALHPGVAQSSACTLLSAIPLCADEMEPQTDGTMFAAYTARYPVPHKRSGSSSNLWYSFDVGAVHMVVLTPYAAYERGTPQYKWLEKDLAAFDRRTTPWLVVSFHAPWYNTVAAHYQARSARSLDLELEGLQSRRC